MLNKFLVAGRLTADPEIKTVGENRLCKFTIACDRPKRKGEENPETDFFPCTAWNRNADVIVDWFGKGDMVTLVGVVHNNRYEKDGQKRSSIEVKVEEIHFSGGKKKQEKPKSVKISNDTYTKYFSDGVKAKEITETIEKEFLRRNKFELNKMVAGVTTKGELIEVDDICPSLDFCVHEIEHIALMTPDKLTPDTMLKVYAKRGYKVNSWEDTEILRVTQQLHTNVVAYLTPYINEFTIDIIPQASFSPVLGEYLKDVPVLVKNSDAFKETLCHRRKTLSANGLKIHFENSTFTKDVLLKEIYHNGAIVCLYRIETSQGETAGFYNTQTKQFVSMFTHTEEQTTLLGNYIENTILWCYAAFVGSDTSILPTAESYNEYLSDPNAEITFTSIGGKLRVPTETKHIRTIAGDDRYETEVKHISGYIRKLPDGQKASERAVTLAQSLGYDLADNETYVQPFERSSWIIRK